MLHREQFDREYHMRSLSETCFSTIKRVLGSTVRAKSPTGQASEIYLKVLSANLRILVQAIFNMGIEPSFWMKPKETLQ